MPWSRPHKEVVSNPPEGKREVVNIWWDPDTQEIVVELD